MEIYHGIDHFDLQNTISLTTTECAQRIKKQQKNIDLHASDGLLIPTSVVTLHSDMKTCMVGYTASCIGQYDIETAKLLTMLVPKQDDAILNSTREAQVNQACIILFRIQMLTWNPGCFSSEHAARFRRTS